MSRELGLVVLGAGLLTAGYIWWPEQEFEKRNEEQTRKRVGGNGARATHGPAFVYVGYHGSSSSPVGGGRPGMAGVSKGGFGSIGGRVGGGFGG
jgi:hypothetical protein